jgi:hypothetical protein
MAHFAQLENNVVIQVIVVSNQDTADEHGVEKEDIGIAFCSNLLGGTWKQTSYNGKIRKKYAAIGDKYDESRDAFIEPKPYASWVLDETICRWKAPVAMPTDGKIYTWDEATTSWVEAPLGE